MNKIQEKIEECTFDGKFLQQFKLWIGAVMRNHFSCCKLLVILNISKILSYPYGQKAKNKIAITLKSLCIEVQLLIFKKILQKNKYSLFQYLHIQLYLNITRAHTYFFIYPLLQLTLWGHLSSKCNILQLFLSKNAWKIKVNVEYCSMTYDFWNANTVVHTSK